MSVNVEMAVQLIEWFKQLSGYSTKEFLEYMNNNNVWEMLNNSDLIHGCIWAEEEDVINIFGRYLTKDERLNIISRNRC